MDIGVVGARLASSVVAPLVKQLFVRGGKGAGLVDRPVRVSGLISFRGERQVIGERGVRRIADELVRRSLAESGERPLAAGEEDAVAEALTRTLLALGDVTMDDVQAVQLGHRAFAQRLRAAAPQVGRELPLDAEQLYGSLLDTACLHILHFFTQRSSFVPRQQVEQSRQLRQVVDRLDQLADRLPSLPTEDARFERRYADYVAKKHGSLTIYGLDLQHSREWPLDAAYLSLQAEAPDQQHDGLFTEAPVDGARQPADRALAGHERVFLRGLAGSGKTTLVQWLAVTAARQDATAGLPHLLGRIPFVLPLRTLTRRGGELPLPADFLASIGCPLAGAQPRGWIERVLTAGRALLLVDGIDEAPEGERERTRRWVRDQLTAFPGNLWLVTSRPTAVREGWLATEDFTDLSLSPMRDAEIAAFVQRWHNAAGAQPTLEASLLDSLRTKADLRLLATNPLMCGLICALHRERRGHLPRSRKALYDAALAMLLYRRDLERDVYAQGSHPIELDDESQTELLQKLAYWLIRNGRSELDQADAVRLLGRVLPSMSHVAAQGTAEQIFRHLLLRCGLLREPGPETVDFVHRTFQDYLGAREAVDESDFDLLVDHAHLDQWSDVLRMAVAHASRKGERESLLRKLLVRGDKEPDHRARLHLLATACLDQATKLDPEVSTAVKERAAALIPPRSIDEAKELAATGPIVLELLPGPDGLKEDEVQAVVHTACQIGGEAAMPLLLRYLDHPLRVVRHQLAGHWDRFDTAKYAREVIRPTVTKKDVVVAVRSAEELAELRGTRASHVKLRGDFTPQQILDALDPRHVIKLGVMHNSLITELSFLRDFTQLESLDLVACAQLTELTHLGELPLRFLQLVTLPTLTGLAPIRKCDELTNLHLGAGVPLEHFSPAERLPDIDSVECLGLSPENLPFVALDTLTQLRELTVWGNDSSLANPAAWRAWTALKRLPRLEALYLSAPSLAVLDEASAPLAQVTSLTVSGLSGVPELDKAVRLFPSLTTLQVANSPAVDLTALTQLLWLRELRLYGNRSVTGLEYLPPRVQVHRHPRPRD